MHNIKKNIEKKIENIFMNYILALHFNVYNIYFLRMLMLILVVQIGLKIICASFTLNLHPITYLRLWLIPAHTDHMQIKTWGRACLDPFHRPGNYYVLDLYDKNLVLKVCLPLRNKKNISGISRTSSGITSFME